MKDLSKFIIVNKNNRVKIGRKLQRLKGQIIIAEPGSQSYRGNVRDIEISLFDRPKFSEGYLHLNRGSKTVRGEVHQTGWENDRQYRLVRVRVRNTNSDAPWQMVAGLFERLTINQDYTFKIDFQSVVGRGIQASEGGMTIYVPRDKDQSNLRAALAYSLKKLIGLLNNSARSEPNLVTLPTPIFESDLEKILDYILHDLKTGNVLKKNVELGQEADSMFFK